MHQLLTLNVFHPTFLNIITTKVKKYQKGAIYLDLKDCCKGHVKF